MRMMTVGQAAKGQIPIFTLNEGGGWTCRYASLTQEDWAGYGESQELAHADLQDLIESMNHVPIAMPDGPLPNGPPNRARVSEFQSTKHPDLPPDRIRLNFKAPRSQRALWTLAEDYAEAAPEFAEAIKTRLRALGYEGPQTAFPLPITGEPSPTEEAELQIMLSSLTKEERLSTPFQALNRVGDRVEAWRLKNFGKQTVFRHLAQITEELGEAARAIGKADEGIRPGTRGNLADELGDIILAVCGLAADQEINLDASVSRRLGRMEALDFTKDPEGGRHG